MLKSEKNVHCAPPPETILKEPQSLTPLKIVVDDIELDENTSILLEDPTTSLGPFAIYENYKVKFVEPVKATNVSLPITYLTHLFAQNEM